MDKPHACVSRIGKINFDYADFKEALDKIPKGIPNVLLAKHSYVEGGGGGEDLREYSLLWNPILV